MQTTKDTYKNTWLYCEPNHPESWILVSNKVTEFPPKIPSNFFTSDKLFDCEKWYIQEQHNSDHYKGLSDEDKIKFDDNLNHEMQENRKFLLWEAYTIITKDTINNNITMVYASKYGYPNKLNYQKPTEEEIAYWDKIINDIIKNSPISE